MIEEAKRIRHALHAIPELGFDLSLTNAYLIDELKKLKPDRLDVFCGTGIRAVYCCNDDAETVAFRADMDALPIHEETGLPFCSGFPGRMHACGHDGHMTALLLFAQEIARRRKQLRKNVVLIFQPSEETGCGADKMVKAGVLEDPHVDRIYACHLWPGIPKGYFATREGVLMAQSCYPDIDIYGKSAHGATPDQGTDAVVAAAGLINALQTIISRNTPPGNSVVVSFGKIEGGSARNVIADHVHMEGTVRAFSETDFDRTMMRMEEVMKGIAEAYGVRIQMNPNDHYPCVINDKTLVKKLKQLLKGRLFDTAAVPIAEDFAFYQQKTPGVMIFAGIEDGVHQTKLHSSTFNFDESVLPGVADLFLKILEEEEGDCL